MSIREARLLARQYVLIGAMLAASWFVSTHYTQAIDTQIQAVHEGGETLLVLFGIVFVFALGFIIYELAKPTIIPSFVLAIFFGIMTRESFGFLLGNPVALSTLITIGAILILFGGGLETPFTKFRRLLGPILSLAIFGTVMNAFIFSLVLHGIATAIDLPLPLAASVLLGAALASTDPAAIIPSFQCLLFSKPRVKHIAISESAINDVVGAVLVSVFLVLFTGTWKPTSVMDAYAQLATVGNLLFIIRVVAIGSLVGIAGFGILHVWGKWKARVFAEEGSDAALFLGVPLLSYTVASILGGSGFLAVFLSGLLFHLRAHFRHVEHYFNHTIEGFMKPMIFMLLGAMVDPAQLWDVAGLGIIAGLIFMFALRPLIVLISLLPFLFGKRRMEFSEVLFLCFVRETGVIPAALLISISLAGIAGSDLIMAVGLWVILLTLIIEPPLTPFVARRLGIAKACVPLPARKHAGPVAVLCSRGFSFPSRMQTVVDWAEQHGVDNIILLHCPEERYTPDFVQDVKTEARSLFTTINDRLIGEGKKEINFEFLCGEGLLQENIEKLIAEGDVSIIFVGTKMLDYRMEDVKRLNVPFFFMP